MCNFPLCWPWAGLPTQSQITRQVKTQHNEVLQAETLTLSFFSSQSKGCIRSFPRDKALFKGPVHPKLTESSHLTYYLQSVGVKKTKRAPAACGGNTNVQKKSWCIRGKTVESLVKIKMMWLGYKVWLLHLWNKKKTHAANNCLTI